MNFETYRRYVNVTHYLCNSKTKPSPLFQTFIEKKLNDVSYTQFFKKECKDTNRSPFYIRLKKPFKKNSKERGLKVCMFNDSVVKENCIGAGTTIMKFTPLLKVISFSNNYCCECGKCLIEFEKTEAKLTDVRLNSEGETNSAIKRCSKCNLRVFCSEECKTAANLKWHNLECMFIQYMRKEIIIPQQSSDCFEVDDCMYQRSVMLILTSFRLLLLLGDGTEIDCQLIANFTDHFEIYERYIKSGDKEQNILFESTVKIFAPVIQGFFSAELKKCLSTNDTVDELHEKGLIRLFLLVFVNVSTLMNYFNDDIGLMFDPVFSMINHSCDPNCTIVWRDQCEINVKSIKCLKPAEELSLNYIPIYMPKEMRQLQLRDSFFFQCECERCRITDKKFDTMLPLDCKYCGQNNRGFLLKNFEVNDSLPNIDKKVICTNCESVIDAELVFLMYMQIMNLFQQINPHLKNIEMLAYWSITPSNVIDIEPALLNKSISIWKSCYEVIPLKSWPMSMLTNLAKTQQQVKNPYSLSTLRLSYLSGFLIENMLETNYVFKTNIGSSIYDLAVSAADFLFDQYLVYKNQIDNTILTIIGWGTFSLCILSYKHLSVRFDNECDGKMSSECRIEKAQRDMIQLSNEILNLFKHLRQIDEQTGFNNKIFAKHIVNFEAYMNCGCESQLKSVILPLDESDYARFGVTETLSKDDAVCDVELPDTYVRGPYVPTGIEFSGPALLLKRPRWIDEL